MVQYAKQKCTWAYTVPTFQYRLTNSRSTTTATFAQNTIIMASHKYPKIASKLLKNYIYQIQTWLHTWRIKVNEHKSTHVNFTVNRDSCLPITLNNLEIPKSTKAKY